MQTLGTLFCVVNMYVATPDTGKLLLNMVSGYLLLY